MNFRLLIEFVKWKYILIINLVYGCLHSDTYTVYQKCTLALSLIDNRSPADDNIQGLPSGSGVLVVPGGVIVVPGGVVVVPDGVVMVPDGVVVVPDGVVVVPDGVVVVPSGVVVVVVVPGGVVVVRGGLVVV